MIRNLSFNDRMELFQKTSLANNNDLRFFERKERYTNDCSPYTLNDFVFMC